MKPLFAALLAMTLLTSQAQGNLMIHGVIDGDLDGGNPKAIVLSVLADVNDLSMYGVGSANNGGGTDGEEFKLSRSGFGW